MEGELLQFYWSHNQQAKLHHFCLSLTLSFTIMSKQDMLTIPSVTISPSHLPAVTSHQSGWSDFPLDKYNLFCFNFDHFHVGVADQNTTSLSLSHTHTPPTPFYLVNSLATSIKNSQSYVHDVHDTFFLVQHWKAVCAWGRGYMACAKCCRPG